MFSSEANATELDLSDDKNINNGNDITVVTAVMMMLKTAQTREIIMKRNLTLIELKTLFLMIVMVS